MMKQHPLVNMDQTKSFLVNLLDKKHFYPHDLFRSGEIPSGNEKERLVNSVKSELAVEKLGFQSRSSTLSSGLGLIHIYEAKTLSEHKVRRHKRLDKHLQP